MAQEPEILEPGSRRQLMYALLMVILLAVTKLAGFIAYSFLAGPTGEDPFAADGASFVAMGAIGLLWVALIRLGVLRWQRTSLSQLGWGHWRPKRDIPLGMFGALLCIGIVLGLYAVLLGEVNPLLEMIRAYAPSQRLLFALIGVQAAFGEETVFRGMLQPGLMSRLGRGPGLLLGAALFSLYHLQFAWPSLVSKFLYGIIYGVLRERTQSLWPPAIAHGLFWMSVGAA